ncbi:COG1215 Glycosyltransferases, probably involved in cell wall biogenesis [Candidatus Nanopelagicaceae bacterium]
MELTLFAIAYLLLLISLFNYYTIRIPKNSAPVQASVTLLLPVRNEEENIAECIAALKSQSGVENLKFIIINDQSTDKTAALLASAIADDARFTVVETEGPRTGWLGKVSALQSGYEAAGAEFIVTLDADVRLSSGALCRVINQLSELNLDFISPYPRQEARTVAEKLIQPLLHWSWMSTIILRLAEKKPHPSTAVANGQFFIARKSALDAVGGFQSVQNQILDDIEIARSLIKSGFRGVVTEGAEIAHTRMYQNFSEIREGYGKSLHKAFGGKLGAVVATSFIAMTGILPVVFALRGSLIATITFLLIAFTRALSALRAKSNPFYALLHPISSALLIYLIAYSWRKRGSIQWKGRTV